MVTAFTTFILRTSKVQPGARPRAVDTELGAGDANYSSLFAEIRKSGWSGVMVIETDGEQFAKDPQAFVNAASAFFKQQQGD